MCAVGKAMKREAQGVGSASSTSYSHGGTCSCSVLCVLRARALCLCVLCAANICEISSVAPCSCSTLRCASLLCASRFHPQPYADDLTLLHICEISSAHAIPGTVRRRRHRVPARELAQGVDQRHLDGKQRRGLVIAGGVADDNAAQEQCQGEG